MPRPRFSNWPIQLNQTLAPSASTFIIADQLDTFYPQYCLQATWPSTSATTGYSIYIYRGYSINETIVWTTGGDELDVDYPPAAGSGSPVTTVNDWDVNSEQTPRYIGFQVINLDASHPMTYNFVGDR